VTPQAPSPRKHSHFPEAPQEQSHGLPALSQYWQPLLPGAQAVPLGPQADELGRAASAEVSTVMWSAIAAGPSSSVSSAGVSGSAASGVPASPEGASEDWQEAVAKITTKTMRVFICVSASACAYDARARPGPPRAQRLSGLCGDSDWAGHQNSEYGRC
jgi:hypothetical protein